MQRALAGRGRSEVEGRRDRVWSALLDPAVLQSLIPGADLVERLDDHRFRAVLSFGVGRVRSRYDIRLGLSGVVPPHRLELSGDCTGLLSGGRATAQVLLADAGHDRTVIAWSYDGAVTGPVALAGAALLRASSTLFIRRFFAALARHAAVTTGEAGSFQPRGSQCALGFGLVHGVDGDAVADDGAGLGGGRHHDRPP